MAWTVAAGAGTDWAQVAAEVNESTALTGVDVESLRATWQSADTLEQRELIRPAGTVPSRSGPQRTIREVTPSGARAVTDWLNEPVSHVRDARSLLMLKLLFINRRLGDATPLLHAQREQLSAQADRLAAAVDESEGFDRTLLLWRFYSTTAAIQFTETMLSDRTGPRPGPRRGRSPRTRSDRP